MTTIILLLIVGLVFYAVEILVPGGFFGLLGLLSQAAAIVVALVVYDGEMALKVFFACLLLSGLMLFIMLKLIQTGSWRKKIFLDASIEGVSKVSDESDDLVGKEGETLTPLNPTGLIAIDGKKHEAYSQSGSLSRGTRVKVVAVESFRLKVTSL